MTLLAVACGGSPDRPDVQEVSGTTEYIGPGLHGNANTAEAPCEHGTITECKVWITDVDCFTGVAVCDHGEFTSCMDADAAEATLAELDEPVAPLE